MSDLNLSPDEMPEDVRKAFEEELNSHGYSFQYAIAKAVNQLATENKSGYFCGATEFPVEVRNAGTRIDLLLHRTKMLSGHHWTFDSGRCFLVGECKRVNPAFGNWCFLKVPNFANNPQDFVSFQLIKKNSINDIWTQRTTGYGWGRDICHLGIEVKTDKKGDKYGKGKGEIEEAATQVCRGMNGFLNFLATHPQIIDRQRRLSPDADTSVAVLPVIFTTANLWVSDVDITSAVLTSGEIDFNAEDLTHTCTRRPWLIYQYRLSPGITHTLPPAEPAKTVIEALEHEFVRSIAIVNPEGLQEFLLHYSRIDFEV